MFVVTRLKLSCVEYFYFLVVNEYNEDTVGHKVDLIDLFLAAVVAVHFNFVGLIVNIHKLNHTIPSDSHNW